MIIISCIGIPISFVSQVAANSNFLSWMASVDTAFIFSLFFGVLLAVLLYSPKILAPLSPVLVALALEVFYEMSLLYTMSLFILNNPASIEQTLCLFFTKYKGELICSLTADVSEVIMFCFFVIICILLLLCTITISTVLLWIIFQQNESKDKIPILSIIDSTSNHVTVYCCTRKMVYILYGQIVLLIIYVLRKCVDTWLQSSSDVMIYNLYFVIVQIFTANFFGFSAVFQLILLNSANRSCLKFWTILAVSVCNMYIALDSVMNRGLEGEIETAVLSFLFPVISLIQVSIFVYSCIILYVQHLI